MKIRYTDFESEEHQDLFILHFGESCTDSRKNLEECIVLGLYPIRLETLSKNISSKIYNALIKINVKALEKFTYEEIKPNTGFLRRVKEDEYEEWFDEYSEQSERILLEFYLLFKRIGEK